MLWSLQLRDEIIRSVRQPRHRHRFEKWSHHSRERNIIPSRSESIFCQPKTRHKSFDQVRMHIYNLKDTKLRLLLKIARTNFYLSVMYPTSHGWRIVSISSRRRYPNWKRVGSLETKWFSLDKKRIVECWLSSIRRILSWENDFSKFVPC